VIVQIAIGGESAESRLENVCILIKDAVASMPCDIRFLIRFRSRHCLRRPKYASNMKKLAPKTKTIGKTISSMPEYKMYFVY